MQHRPHMGVVAVKAAAEGGVLEITAGIAAPVPG
jgi:hypothetical protein